jgi:uncharacterized membrane protein
MDMQTLASIGRVFYGIAIVAFGLLHVGYGDFVTRVVPWWPAVIPGRTAWAYAIGALLIAAGTAVAIDRGTTIAAALLGSGLLLSFVCLGVPMAAADRLLGGQWTVAGKALALCGGALLVGSDAAVRAALLPAVPSPVEAALARLWRPGAWFFASFLVLCGIQHFIYADFVQTLIPAWIPGARFWTYAAGVALIAGGAGLVVRATARQAGVLTGLMIFSWVFFVHIPRALRTFPQTTNEMTAVFEALAMSGIAWLAAASSVRARTGARAALAAHGNRPEASVFREVIE